MIEIAGGILLALLIVALLPVMVRALPMMALCAVTLVAMSFVHGWW